jgi:hypothetical protein
MMRWTAVRQDERWFHDLKEWESGVTDLLAGDMYDTDVPELA